VYSPVWDRVSPGFFEALGAHVLRGRVFDERDTPDAPHVAVINQEFAEKIFPAEDPIGKRFGLGGVQHSGDYQIVGVVKNITFRNPRTPAPPPTFFVPLLQMAKSDWADSAKARSNFIHSILLRVKGNSPDLTTQIHRTLSAIDPSLTMLNVVTMEGQLSDLLRHERLLAKLGELFGLLALLLASLGLYGVTAYSVSQRTSEIGIRTAIGATRTRVIRMILTSALVKVGIGLTIGIPASLALARLLAQQVYGVKTSDPFILAGAATLLAVSAILAALIPALRAASIDPVKALRA
jgi:predicted permease